MCGRYAFFAPRALIERVFGVEGAPEIEPRYNVAPTQFVPVVRVDRDGRRVLRMQRWGLVPFWARDPSVGARMINARAETLGTNAAWPLTIANRPVEAYGSANWSWRSEYFTAVSNSAYSEVDAYGLLSARVGVRTQDGQWDLSLWAKNLTDEEYFQTVSPAATGLVTGVVGEPRYVGATLRLAL